MAKGFMYMITFIDVYSRKIMGWSISNSMTKQWRVAALKDALVLFLTISDLTDTILTIYKLQNKKYKNKQRRN